MLLHFSGVSDYLPKTVGISFESGAFTTTVRVPIVQDNTVEPLQEMFYGSLLTAEDSVIILADRADIFILDDDGRHYCMQQGRHC